MAGNFYGVGVGPGNPEWMTIEGQALLGRVPVVAYPAGQNGEPGFAYRTARRFLDPTRQDLVPLYFPMTHLEEALLEAWAAIGRELCGYLAKGQDVAFITEGDPLVYSTFIHVMRAVRQRCPGVRIHVAPGISSINGAASRLLTPLADGVETLAVVPAQADPDRMRKMIEWHDTVVFIKVAKVLPMMVRLLDELGLLGHAWAISQIGTPDETVFWDIREVASESLSYMTVLLVKKPKGGDHG